MSLPSKIKIQYRDCTTSLLSFDFESSRLFIRSDYVITETGDYREKQQDALEKIEKIILVLINVVLHSYTLEFTCKLRED